MKYALNVVLIILFAAWCHVGNCQAQGILQKKISISVSKAPLSKVLNSIERQGNFFFSYRSNLFNADSLITIHAKNRSISEILNTIFGNRFQYRVQSSHLIITQAVTKNRLQIHGTIIDMHSGVPVPFATVYERNQLVAAMTDEKGDFRLMLKRRGTNDSLSVSRVSYKDTTLAFQQDHSAEIEIGITAINRPLDSVVVSMLKRNWLERGVLSSRQIINSINLRNFFTKQPFQFSVLPGISSHGKMSSQMVNKFSFNLLGGYNGGVNGMEIAGLYNIANRDVRYFQIAGLFNQVGGNAEGFQVAGLFNKDSTMKGFQVAGVFNRNVSARGFQVATVNRNDTMSGFQVGTVNINRRFKGVQIGVINVADTIEGIPIGLINTGKGGIHHVSFACGELGVLFLSYKSGNPGFYNILVGGSSLNFNEKAYALGYGFGKELKIMNAVSLNPELTSLYFFNGNKEKQNISARFQMNIQFNVSKSFSLFAGPAVTVLYSRPGIIPDGYKSDLSNGAHRFSVAKNTIGWFGWNVGVNLF